MALEQQDNQITEKSIQTAKPREKSQAVTSSQLELIPTDGSMNVSFYYIPHMSSLVEVQRVRKALLPFSDLLIEHSIDLDARHLVLYHQQEIENVTTALEYLSLGAELQQTMPHYEPVEVFIQKSDSFDSMPQHEGSQYHLLHVFQKFFYAIFTWFRLRIEALQKKKD